MSSKIKIVFICVITLQMIINTTSEETTEGGVGGGDQPSDKQMCEYTEADVRIAFNVGDYIVMVANVKDKSGVVQENTGFHVFYTVTRNPKQPLRPPYYEAKRWLEIEKLKQELNLSYVFSTTNLQPIFAPEFGDAKHQKNNQIHYFVSGDTKSKDWKVVAYEFDGNKPEDHTDPTFEVLNSKIVYKPSEPEIDATDNFNLKLLYYHFPEEIRINAIIIFDRRNTREKSHTYHALVYTTEAKPDGGVFYARHYLKAKEGLYGKYHYVVRRLRWEWDNGYYDHSQQNAICSDKGTQQVTSVAHVFTEDLANAQYIHHLIEYYGTHHRKIQLLMFGNQTITITGDDTPTTGNELFLNCEKHPISEKIHSSDCLQNPKFYVDDQKDAFDSKQSEHTTHGDKESEESDDKYWHRVWIILAIIATIIGIIALIAYEVFSIVSYNKLSETSKQ